MISPVRQLALENPHWLPVLESSYQLALRTNNRFCGAWVYTRLGRWFPSLRPLARYGILEKIDSSRRGKRAYYRMVDLEDVHSQLTLLGLLSN